MISAKSVKDHGNNHREMELPHGNLHVFANDEVFYQLDYKVFQMADNNLQIPRNIFMSYTPDAHPGIGTCIGTTAVWKMKDGFVSPSIVGSDIGCGMRVHLTPLKESDIRDKRFRRKIVQTIEKYVPVNETASSEYRDIPLENVVKNGLTGLPTKYLPDDNALTHVEHASFDFDHDHLDRIPKKVWTRSHSQLGTLGGGNHFIELQVVEIDRENRTIAERWGLKNGQVVVMIHSGSRAWGGMMGSRITREFKKQMEMWGVRNPDPNLVYVPISTDAGQMYINLMYSALNFAVTNRHLIAYGVLQAMKDVFGSDFEMPVLYDLMHNYALKEPHRNQLMLVHRKGATRALPPDHFLNPPAYRKTGHPVLIPGSMGTSSYILVGRQEGVKNFYSVCHGAGRVRSRRATKEQVSIDQFSASLKIGTDDEIIVNQKALEDILDECPQAYKDVDQIIDSVVGAKLASVVAKLKPVAVIKGI